ncbi:MAG: phosphoribosyl-ATP diphosphatase [Fervidicoccaceae archaeon]
MSSEILLELCEVVEERLREPRPGSYTSMLAAQGLNGIAKKLGEEWVELLLAASSGSTDDLINEAADVVYHMTVLLARRGVCWREVLTELERRRRER